MKESYLKCIPTKLYASMTYKLATLYDIALNEKKKMIIEITNHEGKRHKYSGKKRCKVKEVED